MTGTPLPGVLAPLGPLLDHYGYLAVAGLIIVEDFGVPAPGETVLIAAAVYAGAGRLNILAFNALGAALWVALWASLGDLAAATSASSTSRSPSTRCTR